MTTASLQGPARVPTPRPKAHATASVTPESAAAFNDSSSTRPPPPASTPTARSGTPKPSADTLAPSQAAGYRRGARSAPSDPLSDKATLILIRRVLCPQNVDKGRGTPAPIEDVLPPLTSRNDVDLQLYALFAIILREYVQNWYNKITPDETFVAEIIQILAHVTRALEQRLRKVDLESLLFDEIPDLLDRHMTAYRAAQNPIAQPPVQTDFREIYHSMCPLPALSPVPKSKSPSTGSEQAENEAAYRQLLVQGVLAILLPTEDLENECLTALVGQIFSELIIGNVVASKLSEPWLIWESLIILSRIFGRKKEETVPRPLKRKSVTGDRVHGGGGGGGSFSLQGLFLSFAHWCFAAAAFGRFLVTTVILSRSLPSRSVSYGPGDKVTRHKSEAIDSTDAAEFVDKLSQQPTKLPVLAFHSWAAISNLIELDARMPWLSGALAMLQWVAMTGPGRIADVDGILDRLLSHYIHRYVLDPAVLPPLLRSVRGALFPNNVPGQSTLVAPSSEAELRALRRRCANALWTLVPKGVGSLYLGGGLLKASRYGGAGSAAGDRTAGHNGGGHDGIHSADLERGDVARQGSLLISQLSSPRSGHESRSGPTNDVGGAREKKQVVQDQDQDQDQDRNRTRNSQAQSQSGALSSKKSSATNGRQGGGDAAVGASSGSSQPGAPMQPPTTLHEQHTPPFSPANGDGGGVAKRGGNNKSSGNGSSGDIAAGDGGRQSGGSHGSPIGDRQRTDGHHHHQPGTLIPGPSQNERQDAEDMDDYNHILAEIDSGILDVFGDAYCNKHLIYSLAELVLVRLMPELAEKGVVELWEERL